MVKPIQAKKSFGQNFLVDPAHCRQIASFARIEKSDIVIEIGPGTGQLTAALLESALLVIGIEIDRELVQLLKNRFSPQSKYNFEIITADVLDLDWNQLFSQVESRLTTHSVDPTLRVKLIGNLPYNIATRIITSTTHFASRFQNFTFMVQKEVAERILAKPGNKDYGYLTLLVDFYFERAKGFDIPPGAFHPKPKVTSHVMQIVPRRTLPDVVKPSCFVKVIQTAFCHRRKTLLNNLLALKGDREELEQAFQTSNLQLNVRPEQVNLDGYLSLARVLF